MTTTDKTQTLEELIENWENKKLQVPLSNNGHPSEYHEGWNDCIEEHEAFITKVYEAGGEAERKKVRDAIGDGNILENSVKRLIAVVSCINGNDKNQG